MKKNIKVFQSEINDGIGELVTSTASVAYCSEAVKCKAFNIPEKNWANEIYDFKKTKAENKDQLDLYYLESVLVSCGWKKTMTCLCHSRLGQRETRQKTNNSTLCTMRMTLSDISLVAMF